MFPPVTSTETCIYPSFTLAVMCLNAFQPLTCSIIPLKMRRKRRIAGVNAVKSVCFLLHQEKRGRGFHPHIHQLTSLPHCGSWVVLRLSSADVSGTIWVNLGLSFISPFQLSISQWQGKKKREKKKKTLQTPDVSSYCNISKKSWSKYTVVLIGHALAF